ncbi:MAG: hypothetical protein HY315_04530 [Acidobacteria bacterium]|nr:hypothetical protein [Acidobacteriota bacterium]
MEFHPQARSGRANPPRQEEGHRQKEEQQREGKYQKHDSGHVVVERFPEKCALEGYDASVDSPRG